MSDQLYLRENVQIEPLVDRWHAHAYLIAPAPAAFFLHRQLQIMQSYIRMPGAHAAALANPAMRGGEFIDYGGERVSEIIALRDTLQVARAELLALRDGIAELDVLVQNSDANGLRELYDKVPSILRGLVELTYDLAHRPSARLIEALLYSSTHDDSKRQALCLSLVKEDSRPFIFGTPRLDDPDSLILPIPFNSSAIDELAALRYKPAAFEDIAALLNLGPDQLDLMYSFLSLDPGRKAPRFEGPGLRIRYFGHACLLFETSDLCVLVDPLIAYPYEAPEDRFTMQDLPAQIDAVVITHAHHDHFVIEQLLAIRERVSRVIVPRAGGSLQDPSLKLILESIGFRRVDELAELESIDLGPVTLTALPFLGEHCDLDIRAKMIFMLRARGTSCLIAADSDVLDRRLFERTRELVGPADQLFISQEAIGAPMAWAYGPLFAKPLSSDISGRRRSRGPDAMAALELARIFDVKVAHLYAMGTEPWLQYLMGLQDEHHTGSDSETEAFLARARESSIQADRLHMKAEFVLT